MPNSPTKKDCTQYSKKQLFNLINQLEQKSVKLLMIKEIAVRLGSHSELLNYP